MFAGAEAGVHTIVVWIPMLDGDERSAVDGAAAIFAGTAAPQFWDGAQLFGKAVGRSLGAADWPAWDVYLFYPPGARWDAQGPPAPEAALAQAGGVVVGSPGSLPPAADQSRLLDALRGHAIVVGEQADLAALFTRVADGFAARYPAPTR
jgi:hypothetical protein